MACLSVGVSDVGWINISQYDEATSEWKEIMKNYNPWDFQEQFLADVADWYGEDAVPEYKAALEEATADLAHWADDDPEDPPPSARRGKKATGKRQHYWVYRRVVWWHIGRYDYGPSVYLDERYEPRKGSELRYAPWLLVDDVWAASAERAVEIVKERLCKKPGGSLNLTPPGVLDLLRKDNSCRVDWTCGPEPADW